ncbi:uncharacterized protein LOC116014727 [Ipomoea triloba]|uniref:uncharacterized protein LOC116014727 n=1 Tax=Ipomoea triloba TaxID=35885 RepID=UPI00125DF0D9|nr:uncharacterized protein LOC116014727 [Ipomoea triloba]
MITDEGSTREEVQTQPEGGDHHQDPPDLNNLEASEGPGDPMAGVEFTEGPSSSGLGVNCQGAASKEFRRALLLLMNKVKADVVGLMESRISGNVADKVCKSFGFDNWVRVEAVGFSGGIWVLWKNNVNVEIIATNPQFILTRITKGDERLGLVSFVYGSPANNLRSKLWENLSNDKLPLHAEWLTVGDYNAVTSMEDVSNKDKFHAHRCTGMRNWIFKEGLIDIGFFGARYTWTRGRDNATFTGARLDRALCKMEWITQYPTTKVTHLTRICSDHSPLLVEVGNVEE